MNSHNPLSKLRSIPFQFHARTTEFVKRFGIILISLALITKAAAFDTSSLPPFELEKEKRQFKSLSIHPDGERWLITECTDRVHPPRNNCYLFLHNLRTKQYQRYELSEDYIYDEAEFSPSGQYIVGRRTPYFDAVSFKEFEKILHETQIFKMRVDGSDFRVLPVPKGMVSRPRMSPDETRVAFWLAAKLSQATGKTLKADYELYELDLPSGDSHLFAGPLRLGFVGSFGYRDNNHIVAQAFGSMTSEKFDFDYQKRVNFNEVYCFNRGQTEHSDPCVTNMRFASMPTLNQSGDLYVLGADKKLGLSVFEILPNKSSHRLWQLPSQTKGRLANLVAAPDGSYLGFIYPTDTPKDSNFGLGILDLTQERWVSVPVPRP